MDKLEMTPEQQLAFDGFIDIMVIVDFYTSDNQKHWLNEIKRSDWNAGKFLYPDVGPIAGWPPHQSIDESLNVIRNVLNGKEAYAICLKEDGKAIGAIELKLNGHTDLRHRHGVPFQLSILLLVLQRPVFGLGGVPFFKGVPWNSLPIVHQDSGQFIPVDDVVGYIFRNTEYLSHILSGGCIVRMRTGP